MSHLSCRLFRLAGGIACGLVAGLCISASADDHPAAKTPETAGRALPEPERHKLEFKFRPGEIVRYEVSNQSEMTTVKKETRETVRNTSESRRSFTVKDVAEDGSGNLEMMIDWVHMVAEFHGNITNPKTVEFQSDDPARHPPQFNNVLDTVGRPQALIRFSTIGLPLDVKAVNPGQPLNPNAGAAPGTDVSRESYLILLPPIPVAIGDEWKERYDVVARVEGRLPKRIAMLRKYKLAEVKDGLGTIEFSTTILTPVEDPAISGQLIERETAGRIVFDIERGLIVSRDVALDRTVVNPLGEGSSMHARRTYRERILPSTSTAGRDGPAATTNVIK